MLASVWRFTRPSNQRVTVPKISVVIPTYNGGKRLLATIASVQAQTAPAHQIIVVDDGSTDGTPALCQAPGLAIEYVRAANGGQQRARNTGVAHATGDWIALLDHDDLWHPEYLAELTAFLTGHDAELVIANGENAREAAEGRIVVEDPSRLTTHAPDGYWRAMGADPAARWSLLPRYDHAGYLAFHPCQPSVTAVNAAFYRAIGGFDERMRGSSAENFEFEIRALRQARVGLLWRPLVTIVNHGANAGADGGKMAMDLVHALTFALAHHGLTAGQAASVAAARRFRLPDAIAAGFAAGEFAALATWRPMLTNEAGLKTRLKCAIARLPLPLARAAAAVCLGWGR